MERKLSKIPWLNPREFLRGARRDPEMEKMLERVYEEVRNQPQDYSKILDWQILNNRYVGQEEY